MILPKTKIAPINDWLTRAESALLPYLITQPPLGWDQTPTGLVPPNPQAVVIDFPFRMTRATVNSVNGLHVSLGTADETYQVKLGSALGDEMDFNRTNNFLPTWSNEEDQRAIGNGAVVLHWYVDDSDEWSGSVDNVVLEWYEDPATIPYPITGTIPSPIEHWYAVVGYDHPDSISNVIQSHVRLTRLGQSGNDWCVYSIA